MAQTSWVYRTALVTLLSLAAAATAAAQVSGGGTPGKVTKWTGPTTVGNSGIAESGGKVGLGMASSSSATLSIREGDGLVQARSSLSTLVTGSDNGGAIYFGVDASGKNTPTAGIETSWGGGALFPQIGIGVTRDFSTGPRANLLMDYNGNTNIRQGKVSRLLVHSSGNVGIGTTVPLEKVHVEGTGVVRARIGSDTNAGIRLALQGTPEWSVATVLSGFEFPTRNFQIYNERKGLNALLIDSNNLNIQTGAGLVAGGEVYPLVDGGPSLGKSFRRWSEVWAKKGTISTSDARWKRDVTNLDDGLARVMKLRPVAFRWKDEPEGTLNLGLIAQEVEQVLPEAVTHGSGPDEPLGLNYSSLVPVVIRAIQDQQQILEAKDAQIRDLSEKCSALLRQLEMAQQASSRLESRLAALEEQAHPPSVLARY